MKKKSLSCFEFLLRKKADFWAKKFVSFCSFIKLVLQENRLYFFIGTNEKNIDSIRGIERKLNAHLVMFHNN